MKSKENLKNLAQSIPAMLFIAALLYGTFSVFSGAVNYTGFTMGLPGLLALWYGLGLACAIFWPLRYWKGMRGHWSSALKAAPVLALSGPLAIVLGFPV